MNNNKKRIKKEIKNLEKILFLNNNKLELVITKIKIFRNAILAA
jgi:hypothetical protein